LITSKNCDRLYRIDGTLGYGLWAGQTLPFVDIFFSIMTHHGRGRRESKVTKG
jgi:hypothetical protein